MGIYGFRIITVNEKTDGSGTLVVLTKRTKALTSNWWETLKAFFSGTSVYYTDYQVYTGRDYTWYEDDKELDARMGLFLGVHVENFRLGEKSSEI